MNKALIILFFFFSVTSLKSEAKTANSLKPYFTDGCTLFLDGTHKHPGLWVHCCEEHDMRYWFGGNQDDMDKTDLRLKACVNDVAGATWGSLIYTGVRTGHMSPIKNKTHWGWGWKQNRSDTALNPSEVSYVIDELRHLPYDHETIEKFIERNFPN
jgi:hypothetical protein